MKKITLLFLFCLGALNLGFSQFSQNFDAGLTTPTGWTVINGGGTNTFVFGPGAPGSAFSAPNAAQINYNATAHNDFLVTPSITVAAGVNDRITYYVKNQDPAYVEEYDVKLSTTTATNAAFTVTLTPQAPAPDAWTQFTIDLSPYVGQTIYVGFHAVSADMFRLLFDNIVNDTTPLAVPSCASNFVSTPNATCGNFATSLSWSSVSGADGYYLSVGTTAGGTDILDNFNNSVSTNYILATQSSATTYYWKVTPFNNIGVATGCTENMYTTFATGCYCDSAPTSVDGNGISNVVLGTTSVANATDTYTDSTATIVDFAQGINSNVQITFETGYTYDTNIWIDFNNDFDFTDAGELVKTGIASLVTNPTTLNASFIMPATAPLGQHRMRIGAADEGQVPPAPCYSGTYGVTIDYTVNIITASCVPPAATATIVPACATNQFSINVNVTALGNGTPTVSNGTTTWPITATGILNIGPFANGSTQVLSLLHGSDAVCNFNLGTFTYTCPPVNDVCSTATANTTLPFTFTQNDAVVATNSGGFTLTCGDSGSMNDGVWYTVVGDGADISITVSPTGTVFDPQIGVYTGTCGSFTCVGSVDSGFAGGSETYTIVGSVVGTTYKINIGDYSGFTDNPEGAFVIDVSTTLSNSSFDNANFKLYPNPVKDILNLSYSNKIDSVKVMNILGQDVLVKSVGTNQSQIDMSQLTSGTYLVKVTSDNQVKTIKVVKE